MKPVIILALAVIVVSCYRQTPKDAVGITDARTADGPTIQTRMGMTYSLTAKQRKKLKEAGWLFVDTGIISDNHIDTTVDGIKIADIGSSLVITANQVYPPFPKNPKEHQRFGPFVYEKGSWWLKAE